MTVESLKNEAEKAGKLKRRLLLPLGAEQVATVAGHAKLLLPAKAVCARYGIVERTLARWLADRTLDFPAPMIVNGRRYFAEPALEAFERARVKTPEVG